MIAYATAIVLALGGVGVALISQMRHLPIHRLDLLIGSTIVVAALLVLAIGRARGATAACCALAVATARTDADDRGRLGAGSFRARSAG